MSSIHHAKLAASPVPVHGLYRIHRNVRIIPGRDDHSSIRPSWPKIHLVNGVMHASPSSEIGSSAMVRHQNSQSCIMHIASPTHAISSQGPFIHTSQGPSIHTLGTE